MRYLKSAALVSLLFGLNALHAQTKQVKIVSPDRHVEMNLVIKDNRSYYDVNFNQHRVIDISPLGLTINDKAIGAATAMKIIKKIIINEAYPSRDFHSKATNHCSDVVISFSKGASLSFMLEAKVFNDGVAFRYIVPNKDSSLITADNTGFAIPPNSIVWSQGDVNYYEGQYQKQNIEDVKEGQLAGPPLTIKLPDNAGYAAISEGGLINFSGMSLKALGNRMFKSNLAAATHLEGEIRTPWRIIETGKDLNTLVNCDIIANVSPGPDKALFPNGLATSWVKPGMAVWSWLSDNGGLTYDKAITLENMKRYSKWAGELGIPYNLIDEGWGYWKDSVNHRDRWDMIKELVDYSAKQHVKIWLWKAYPDRKGIPGLKDSTRRKLFFKKCHDLGVAGLKIDFFDSESQEVIQFYQAALKDAARNHLLIDFHGANKPTGQSAQFPNELTREGIRGLEYGKSVPAENTTLPFTRFLAGHADNSPFTLKKDIMDGTTLTCQAATLVLFTSPFMCLAADPEKLLTSPSREMVTGMPTTWDETMVLPQSAIGELAVYARRKGNVWYLSAVNGDKQQELKIDLSFLKAGNYRATIMEDDENDSENAIITHKNCKASDIINISLQPGGGFVGRFVK